MIIRDATEADLPAIVEIFNATIPSRDGERAVRTGFGGGTSAVVSRAFARSSSALGDEATEIV